MMHRLGRACVPLLLALLVSTAFTGCHEGFAAGISRTLIAGSWGAAPFTLTGPGGATVAFNTVFMELNITAGASGTANLNSNATPGTTPGAYSGGVTANGNTVSVNMSSGQHKLRLNLQANDTGTQLTGTATYTDAHGNTYTGNVTFHKVQT